jgi:methylmalonyl-CoA/ethylmalonyl-CoA epimerase
VRDLDAGIAFYPDTYGMTLTHEQVNEEQGVREAMMAVGESGSGIQLLAPLSPESTIAAFLDRSGPGVQPGQLHPPQGRRRYSRRARRA